MKKIVSISFLFLFAWLLACSEEPAPQPQGIGDLTPISGGELVEHTYYKLAYSEEHEQALWVFYKLYPTLVNGSIDRTDDFREDPLVSTGSATLADYKGSGYDRGHLAPAGSMDLNQTAMSESFYMSNMSPQSASCNRGRWKSLEEQVRTWTNIEDTLYVVSGPIFENNLGTIGASNVTVPGYYYKVMYDPTGDEKMLAFIMPNAKMENDIEYYTVSVDEVEAKTGIDFFPGLPDDIEESLESSKNYSGWDFDATSMSSTTSKSVSTAVQCKGIAKSTGARCKNRTTNTNGYCHVHQSQAPGYEKPKSEGYVGRCCATTKAGTRCKRQATGGTRYCWQHQK